MNACYQATCCCKKTPEGLQEVTLCTAECQLGVQVPSAALAHSAVQMRLSEVAVDMQAGWSPPWLCVVAQQHCSLAVITDHTAPCGQV
jgi:hypothetical protein